MKVSFGGNHLIFTNNTLERDSLFNYIKKGATYYKNAGNTYLYKVDNNKVLLIDGKEGEDVSRLSSSALMRVNDNIKQKAIINGYKEKAVIIDVRDNAYYQTQKYNNNNFSNEFENNNLLIEDLPLKKNYTKPKKYEEEFPPEIPTNPSPQRIPRRI